MIVFAAPVRAYQLVKALSKTYFYGETADCLHRVVVVSASDIYPVEAHLLRKLFGKGPFSKDTVD